LSNELKTVEKFLVGLVSEPDSQDIPDDAYTAGSAIDPTGDGKLIGLPTSSSKSTNGDANNFRLGTFIKRAGGQYDLIYYEGSDICAMTDFYGTPGYSVVQSSASGTSFVPHNQEVYIGSTTPRWVGRTDYEQFGVNTYDGSLVAENAEMPQPGSASGEFYISGVSGHAGTNAFTLGATYTYALSCVYDGLQESPLSSVTATFTPAYVDYDYATVTVKCNDGYSTLSAVNRRITGVKIYRKETLYNVEYSEGFSKIGNQVESTTQYKLLKKLDVANDSGYAYGTTAWSNDGTDYYVTFQDANDSIEGAYYDETGMAETWTSFHANYTLNTYGNGYMFIGGCSGTDLPIGDVSHMIIRSREERFSMFNYYDHNVKLETIPKAMQFYNSTLFVFDDNNAYMIDPETLNVVHRFEGAGCPNQKAITVTNDRMFWSNKYNAYQYYGGQVEILTDRIRGNWQTSASGTLMTVYDNRKNVVIFHTGNDAYLWHLGRQRWDFVDDFIVGTFTGGFSGRYGETYASDGSSMVDNFGGASTRAWTYTSKEFTFGTPSQDKEYYHLIVSSTGTVTVTYSINSGSSYRSLTSTTEIKDGSGNWEKQPTLIVKLSGAAASSVDNYEIVLRRMRGVRG
jgi:hypothetical protein